MQRTLTLAIALAIETAGSPEAEAMSSTVAPSLPAGDGMELLSSFCLNCLPLPSHKCSQCTATS